MKTNKLFKTFLTAGLVATTLLTGCSSQSSSEPVKIGIPSDATNGGRGLLLLEKAGLIEVDDKAGWTPELKDVTKYKYNIEIVPTQANTLVSTLDDFGAATINGTYAVPAGLKPKKDGLITEVQEVGSDNPFINVILLFERRAGLGDQYSLRHSACLREDRFPEGLSPNARMGAVGRRGGAGVVSARRGEAPREEKIRPRIPETEKEGRRPSFFYRPLRPVPTAAPTIRGGGQVCALSAERFVKRQQLPGRLFPREEFDPFESVGDLFGAERRIGFESQQGVGD